MSDTLHTKYRPKALVEVVGQLAVTGGLQKALTKGTSRAFLLVGPSGVGKTTMARIAASIKKAEPANIVEIDAATNSGVDDMRKITSLLQYRPWGESITRVIIIDECHTLSKNAWQSLLKSIEEPPEGVYWFLCTTEAGKVPATIKTRCTALNLKPVGDGDLERLLVDIADKEKFKASDDVISICVKEAYGSPRQAIVNLGMCADLKTKKEAAAALESAHGSDATIELARFLVGGGGSWGKMMGILGDTKLLQPESVRIVLMNYFASCIKGAKSERDVPKFLNLLEAFATPYNASEGLAPLFLSLGRVLFSRE